MCDAGETEPCYNGPAGTEGIGACVGGTRTCRDDGLDFGPCVGEVVPSLETCSTLEDDDCDSQVNEEGVDCACEPGDVDPCYSGPVSTLNVGLCHGGTQTCAADGLGYGPCEGEVTPAAETCAALSDEDCDGQVNEEGAACVCVPGSVSACYTGPAGTEGVGACVAGTQTCDVQGTGFGPCSGDVVPAVEDCETFADESCDGATPLCGGTHLWSKQFNSFPSDAIEDIASDPIGDVVVVGRELSIKKLDASGNELWSKHLGDFTESAWGVTTDAASNVLVSGRFSNSVDFGGGPVAPGGNDGFILKLGPLGEYVWHKSFGGASVGDNRVATDTLGNVIVTGTYNGPLDFGSGPISTQFGQDVFLAKLDGLGNYLWTAHFGNNSAADSMEDIAVDTSNNIVILGVCGIGINFGGGALGSGVCLAKFDASGGHQWSKTFPGLTSPSMPSRRVTTDLVGNIFVTGAFYSPVNVGGGVLPNAGGYDIFLVKLDAAGNHLWSARFGSSGDQVPNDVTTDPAGNVFITGSVGGTLDLGGGNLTSGGDDDLFVAKYDPLGNHLWSKRFGSASIQEASAMAMDPAGNVLITGNFGGSLTFGGATLMANAGADFYVAKLAN